MTRKPATEFHYELFDKIWKTKGTRFNASKRLEKTFKLSTSTTSFLAAYLIIVNLLEPFGILQICQLHPNIISFSSVALSIIILVFVQIESANEYNLRSAKFLECAKELSKLFNRLGIILNSSKIDDDLVKDISKEYSVVLEKYDNHINIDYEMHKAISAKDFGIPDYKRVWMLFKINVAIKLKYQLIMISPPIVFIALIMFT